MNELPTDPRSFHVPAGPVVPAPMEAAPPPRPPTPRRRRRRRWPWVVLVLLLVALVPLYFMLSAWRAWSDVDRVDLAGALAGGATGTNYLVVGTDSRDGVDPGVGNAADAVEGERTDTIAVLRVEGDTVKLLAIPRDLYVDIGGSQNRINAAFAFGGPEQLVRTVQGQLGIGIDHYLEVDFAGFLGLVDALGGVTIDFPHPAHDPKSGLAVATAGPTTLDGAQALAYVRSRTYTEVIAGADVVDPRADLGRVERQQAFLGAVFSELGSTRNPVTLLGAVDGVAGNVRVDDTLGLREAMALGLTVRGAEPITFVLPTTRFFTPGGADVQLLDEAAAAPILAEFG